MKVLLAGASGAIGMPLIRRLHAAGHEVLALHRSPEGRARLAAAGTTPIRVDVLSTPALVRALQGQRADAVICEITALKKTPMSHKDMTSTAPHPQHPAAVNTTRLGPAGASTREHQQAISEREPVISVPTTAAEADSASWQSRAACLDCDPDLFFPIAPSGPALQQIEQAKAVCARCPVQRECQEYALATRQVHGVWGGTSEEERQQLRWRERDSMSSPPGEPERVDLPIFR